MEDLWDCSDRHVRGQLNISLPSLVLPEWQTRISGSGCTSTRLARQDTICLSPVITDLEDSVSSARMQPSSAISSSTLAFKTMVSDTSLTDSKTTFSSAQQTRPTESVSLAPTSGPIETLVVASGPTGPLLECSQKARTTVLNARAVSTQRSYTCKCKVFRDWCFSHNIDPLHSSVGCVLDFLQHILELGRSTSTLKFYVAAQLIELSLVIICLGLRG